MSFRKASVRFQKVADDNGFSGPYLEEWAAMRGVLCLLK